jgi:hypothetical protein
MPIWVLAACSYDFLVKHTPAAVVVLVIWRPQLLNCFGVEPVSTTIEPGCDHRSRLSTALYDDFAHSRNAGGAWALPYSVLTSLRCSAVPVLRPSRRQGWKPAGDAAAATCASVTSHSRAACTDAVAPHHSYDSVLYVGQTGFCSTPAAAALLQPIGPWPQAERSIDRSVAV